MSMFECAASHRRHMHHAGVTAALGEKTRRHPVAKAHWCNDALVHLGVAIVVRKVDDAKRLSGGQHPMVWIRIGVRLAEPVQRRLCVVEVAHDDVAADDRVPRENRRGICMNEPPQPLQDIRTSLASVLTARAVRAVC